MLVTYMTRLQCSYHSAANGLEAYEVYRSSPQPFDYVLMDISMPIMNGFESSRRIREFEHETGQPRSKIIALTGLGSSDAQEQAARSGIDLFLPKPVPMKKLREILAEDFPEK